MRGIAERGVMGPLLQMENVRAARSAVYASIAVENMLWARVNFGPFGPNVFGLLSCANGFGPRATIGYHISYTWIFT
ncbi:hypothetical protein ES288_D05G118300v1 [Gossypium darwinii]|uniref:Uncharacterized protein n=1 Tax=Gossypium darwinii TaxID=34276 RepID=A0A5D2CIF6_GOSDA|nr:hypothetical protein ES288_D05G118300v1 [Gossypium darwinii]